MISGQAHGKVILLGEHAVVYGHPALCGALGDGVEVEAVPGEGALVVPAWGVRTPAAAALFSDPFEAPPPGPDSPLRVLAPSESLCQAYLAILKALPTGSAAALGGRGPDLSHDFIARFHIPTAAGLGSSAALAVALSRALGPALGLSLTPAAVAGAALAAERVFHGKPSGLDHTVAQQGGFGLFRRDRGLSPLAARALPLCIGLTGRARDTRGRVARVAELCQEKAEMTDGCFAHIASLVEAGAQAVLRGDLRALGEAMDRNQEELRLLEVSCPEIEEMCRIARGAGAFGAKLTGGGGGGCVIALCPGGEGRIQAAWQAAGFASFVTTVGGRAPGPGEERAS